MHFKKKNYWDLNYSKVLCHTKKMHRYVVLLQYSFAFLINHRLLLRQYHITPFGKTLVSVSLFSFESKRKTEMNALEFVCFSCISCCCCLPFPVNLNYFAYLDNKPTSLFWFSSIWFDLAKFSSNNRCIVKLYFRFCVKIIHDIFFGDTF